MIYDVAHDGKRNEYKLLAVYAWKFVWFENYSDCDFSK